MHNHTGEQDIPNQMVSKVFVLNYEFLNFAVGLCKNSPMCTGISL